MSEEYKFSVTVYLPEDTKSYKCKKYSEMKSGVKLFDIKGNKGSIAIINTPVIITTELHEGLGGGTVQY